MSGVVRWTADASNDLQEIAEYIGDTQQRQQAAIQFVRLIFADCDRYASQPLLGQACPQLLVDGRVFVVRSYLVFYRPTSDGIEVLRIVHGSRDYRRLIVQGK